MQLTKNIIGKPDYTAFPMHKKGSTEETQRRFVKEDIADSGKDKSMTIKTKGKRMKHAHYGVDARNGLDTHWVKWIDPF